MIKRSFGRSRSLINILCLFQEIGPTNGPTNERTPKKPEYLLARSQLTERSSLVRSHSNFDGFVFLLLTSFMFVVQHKSCQKNTAAHLAWPKEDHRFVNLELLDLEHRIRWCRTPTPRPSTVLQGASGWGGHS